MAIQNNVHLARIRSFLVNGSQKYSVDAIENEISRSPTLSALDDPQHKLANAYHQNGRMRDREVQVLIVAIIVFSFVGGGVIAGLRLLFGTAASQVAEIASGLLFGLALLVIMKIFQKRETTRRLIINLYKPIHEMEEHPVRWPDPRFRVHICGHIETAARALADMHKLAHVQDDAIAGGNLAQASARKAAALRWIKVWVLRPQEFTYTDTLAALSRTLAFVIDDRWYDLDEADPAMAPALGGWQRVGLVALGVASLGGVGILIAFGSHLGAGGSILTSVGGVLVLGVLAKLGVSIPGVGQSAQIISDLK